MAEINKDKLNEAYSQMSCSIDDAPASDSDSGSSCSMLPMKNGKVKLTALTNAGG